MEKIVVEVLQSLKEEIDRSDKKIQKLFEKQKRFMEAYPNYPSLGRRKLEGVCDKYGDPLWEIRLNIKLRIVFVEREGGRVVWLKIVNHDDLVRKNTIHADGDYESF